MEASLVLFEQLVLELPIAVVPYGFSVSSVLDDALTLSVNFAVQKISSQTKAHAFRYWRNVQKSAYVHLLSLIVSR